MPTTRIRPTVQLPNYKRLAVTGASGAAAAVNDSSDSSYVRRSADKAPLARFVLEAPTIPADHDIATVVPGARLKQPTSVTPKMVTLAMSVPGTGKPVNEIAPVVNGPVVRAGSGTAAYTYETPAGAGVAAGPTGPWSSLLSALALRVNDGHKASDGNRATIYELFADVYYAARPSVTAGTIVPTSPVTTTSYPELTATLTALVESWQDGSGPAARAEVVYEFKIFSAAQFGASGFDPATSPCMWSTQGLTASLDYIDGSTPSSEAVAETPDRALPNGAYRAYFRGRRYFDAAQFGAWSAADFTVAVVPPTAPTLTARADDAAQRVALEVTLVATAGATNPLVSVERISPGPDIVATNYAMNPSFDLATNGDGMAAGVSESHSTATSPIYTTVMRDEFARSDRVLDGDTADSGETWSVTLVDGTHTDLGIIDAGRFTAPSTVYASILQPAQPTSVGGRFSWAAAGGADHSGMALIMSADATPTLEHMLHLAWDHDGGYLSWWIPGDINNYFPGASSFVFDPPLAEDGTVYEIRMTVDGDTVTVDLPDGNSLVVTDPHVSVVAGPLVIWEPYYPPYSSCHAPRWESVSENAGGQRVRYTGVAADTTKLISMELATTPPASFAPGDPVWAVVDLSGAWSGITGYLYLQRLTDADVEVASTAVALPALTAAETPVDVYRPSCEANTDHVRLSLLLLDIDASDVIDIGVRRLLIAKSSVFPSYFDGNSPNCAWAGAANESVSTLFAEIAEAVRGATDLPAVFGTPTVIFDCEAPRGAAFSYRANVEATVAGQQLASAWTTAAVAGTLSSLGWNIKAPLAPALNLIGAAVNADPEYTQQEDAATFRPVGRKYPVVVSMALGGADGSLTLRARSDAEWATVEALRDYQGTLYLESPFGWGRYIRILSRSWVESGSASAPRRRVDVGFLEVEAP